jgi:hypothetical protein
MPKAYLSRISIPQSWAAGSIRRTRYFWNAPAQFREASIRTERTDDGPWHSLDQAEGP